MAGSEKEDKYDKESRGLTGVGGIAEMLGGGLVQDGTARSFQQCLSYLPIRVQVAKLPS